MSRHLMILVLFAFATSTLFADVPRTISYQGRLTDNGIPVNGLKSVRFKIYDRSSNPIWNSGSVSVTFTDGLFTVELGQSPQPPLPVDIWPSDTAMSLGVTITSNPELSPRLRFKTAPYAMHALTAESANSGGGWVRNSGFLRLENPNDSIGIGTTTPQAKLGIFVEGDQRGLRIGSTSTHYARPAFELISENTTGAIFRRGASTQVPVTPLPAIYATSFSDYDAAAWFNSYSHLYPTVYVSAGEAGGAISTWSPRGYALDAWWGKGIRAVVDSVTAIRAESNFGGGVATVLSSVYTGSATYDHIAVSGYSRPADYYGIGGKFEGGYRGVEGVVYPTGDQYYFGVRGEVIGGNGYNYGVDASASGQGSNIGLYAYADGGTTNWAGYFSGDINVTGSVVKAASILAIDDPTDPENEFLQQAEVVSDNLKAVYDGIITLGADGSATVQLPDWLESFCGDFRYQLTCVGGYAPVYVSSEIAGNQFVIAGGKDGLKVSWQITGIRKDKYALANPLEVEKKKTASEQGKYLHPELFGYGSDRGLSPNPEGNVSVKGKNDAIRAATAALAKPSTPPQRPQLKNE